MRSFELKSAVADMRSIAIDALPRMYRPESGVFAFRLRRRNGIDLLEGISRRYTAIVLLALQRESADVCRHALRGADSHEICGKLVDAVERTDDPGEVALTLWAARTLGHQGAAAVLNRLQAMRPVEAAMPTVELAWALTALSVPAADGRVHTNGSFPLAARIADRLRNSFREESDLFPHDQHAAGKNGDAVLLGRPASRWRSHVCCFADLVYPIQALSLYHQASGNEQALSVARRCARAMCALQGPQGQWWWHYDIRTGRVVERYPVYAIHQDAMGPMALFAARDVGAGDFPEAVERSVRWLYHPPEPAGSLLDREAGVIWRKVARREPNKLSRGLQAVVSSAHPALRAPGVNVLFPPKSVDSETRPYHMGWLLYAWSGGEA